MPVVAGAAPARVGDVCRFTRRRAHLRLWTNEPNLEWETVQKLFTVKI